MSQLNKHVMCSVCAQTMPMPDSSVQSIECTRCGHKIKPHAADSVARTVAFSITALIFYIPANIFPFMTFELYGRPTSSTIWSGTLSLIDSGAWTVAIVVFLASMVIPALKLAILLYLSATARNHTSPMFKTRLYKVVEAIGRWSMLDIFLLAVLVAMVKLGPLGTVHPEIGSLMFFFVVMFTMLASASFDPKFLWKDENEKV